MMTTKLIKTLVVSFLLGHCLPLAGQAPTKSQPKTQLDELNQQLFPGAKLPLHYQFAFPYPFREYVIPTSDKIKLSGLLFKAKAPKGVILYLHGSNNALNVWGKLAPAYTHLQYDVLMLDYRGYGKSGGKISSEAQLHRDMQTVYDYLKKMYPENHIIILGHSMGTGLAARLASKNHPKKLILQAPYYSVADWVFHLVPTFDTTLIRYKLPTYQFLQNTLSPILMVHGDADQAIYCGSSLKLKAYLKPTDRLVILKGEGHTELVENKAYQKALISFLR
jgi:alpha-beta hydrolase superfamily lysophospholipase